MTELYFETVEGKLQSHVNTWMYHKVPPIPLCWNVSWLQTCYQTLWPSIPNSSAIMFWQDLTARETIVKLHHFVKLHQISALHFKTGADRPSKRHYYYELKYKAFRSVRKECFTLTIKTRNRYYTHPFIKGVWCEESQCFKHFYTSIHFHY